MIIPEPKFEMIRIDLSELSLWQRVKYVCSTPPRLKLIEDWVVTLDDGLPIIFPKGFITDLASVPRVFWSVPGLSPFGVLRYGAIPHDFFYQYQYLLTPFDESRMYPMPSEFLRIRFRENFGDNVPVFVGRDQEFADNLMEGIVKEATGSVVISALARKALKHFGKRAFMKYRKNGPSAFEKNSLGIPGVGFGDVVW